MELTGHLTESVYRRYAIVSQADKRAALERTEANLAADPHNSGIFPHTDSSHPGTMRLERTANRLKELAEGEGFEPPRASRPGGFQVRIAPAPIMS